MFSRGAKGGQINDGLPVVGIHPHVLEVEQLNGDRHQPARPQQNRTAFHALGPGELVASTSNQGNKGGPKLNEIADAKDCEHQGWCQAEYSCRNKKTQR